MTDNQAHRGRQPTTSGEPADPGNVAAEPETWLTAETIGFTPADAEAMARREGLRRPGHAATELSAYERHQSRLADAAAAQKDRENQLRARLLEREEHLASSRARLEQSWEEHQMGSLTATQDDSAAAQDALGRRYRPEPERFVVPARETLFPSDDELIARADFTQDAAVAAPVAPGPISAELPDLTPEPNTAPPLPPAGPQSPEPGAADTAQTQGRRVVSGDQNDPMWAFSPNSDRAAGIPQSLTGQQHAQQPNAPAEIIVRVTTDSPHQATLAAAPPPAAPSVPVVPAASPVVPSAPSAPEVSPAAAAPPPAAPSVPVVPSAPSAPEVPPAAAAPPPAAPSVPVVPAAPSVPVVPSAPSAPEVPPAAAAPPPAAPSVPVVPAASPVVPSRTTQNVFQPPTAPEAPTAPSVPMAPPAAEQAGPVTPVNGPEIVNPFAADQPPLAGLAPATGEVTIAEALDQAFGENHNLTVSDVTGVGPDPVRITTTAVPAEPQPAPVIPPTGPTAPSARSHATTPAPAEQVDEDYWATLPSCPSITAEQREKSTGTATDDRLIEPTKPAPLTALNEPETPAPEAVSGSRLRNSSGSAPASFAAKARPLPDAEPERPATPANPKPLAGTGENATVHPIRPANFADPFGDQAVAMPPVVSPGPPTPSSAAAAASTPSAPQAPAIGNRDSYFGGSQHLADAATVPGGLPVVPPPTPGQLPDDLASWQPQAIGTPNQPTADGDVGAVPPWQPEASQPLAHRSPTAPAADPLAPAPAAAPPQTTAAVAGPQTQPVNTSAWTPQAPQTLPPLAHQVAPEPTTPVGQPDKAEDWHTYESEPAPARTSVAGWVAVVIIVILAAVSVWALMTGRGQPASRADSGPTAAVVTGPMRTVALSITDGATPAKVTHAALLGVDSERAHVMTIPSTLTVTVPRVGADQLAVAASASERAAANAIADGLQIRVDESWVLNRDQFINTVNRLGGVQVLVPNTVHTKIGTVNAGDQHLTGETAYEYAAHRGKTEPIQAHGARWAAVLAGVFNALPKDEAGAAAVINTAPVARSAQSTALGVKALAALAAHAQSERLTAFTLPVRATVNAAGQTRHRIDQESAADLLKTRFGSAFRPRKADDVPVTVHNGVGRPGLTQNARDQLAQLAGFTFYSGGNWTSLGVEKSFVSVPADTPEHRQRAEQIRERLGLAPDAVVVAPQTRSKARMLVVLGKDYHSEAS